MEELSPAVLPPHAASVSDSAISVSVTTTRDDLRRVAADLFIP